MNHAGCALILMAKRPDRGRVKTRLAAEFGDSFAARAHEAMLLDLADRWASPGLLGADARRILAYAPSDAVDWFRTHVPPCWTLENQRPGDLGERLRGAFEVAFATGATRVAAIGADSPTLDSGHLLGAFDRLGDRDVVLGPSSDGGYYLIAARPPLPDLFSSIDWSTARVLAQTLDRVRAEGRSLGLLPPWYDVDTPEDWRTLVGHVRGMREAGVDPDLPRVEALIGAWRG